MLFSSYSFPKFIFKFFHFCFMIIFKNRHGYDLRSLTAQEFLQNSFPDAFAHSLLHRFPDGSFFVDVLSDPRDKFAVFPQRPASFHQFRTGAGIDVDEADTQLQCGIRFRLLKSVRQLQHSMVFHPSLSIIEHHKAGRGNPDQRG